MRQIEQTGIITESLNGNEVGAHIDTYQTFDLFSGFTAENEFAYLADEFGQNFEYEDLDFTYDHAGWTRALASASVDVVNDLLADDEIVVSVGAPTSVYSPREYNFVTDSYCANWTIDTDKLEAWLTEHAVTLPNGYGIDGFIRTCDDDYWYLVTGLREYLSRDYNDFGDRYLYAMLEESSKFESEYFSYKLTTDGLLRHAENGVPAETLIRMAVDLEGEFDPDELAEGLASRGVSYPATLEMFDALRLDSSHVSQYFDPETVAYRALMASVAATTEPLFVLS